MFDFGLYTQMGDSGPQGPLVAFYVFFLIYEDLTQILRMLKVFFIKDSDVENLFCCVSPGFEPNLFLSNNLFILRV